MVSSVQRTLIQNITPRIVEEVMEITKSFRPIQEVNRNFLNLLRTSMFVNCYQTYLVIAISYCKHVYNSISNNHESSFIIATFRYQGGVMAANLKSLTEPFCFLMYFFFVWSATSLQFYTCQLRYTDICSEYQF